MLNKSNWNILCLSSIRATDLFAIQTRYTFTARTNIHTHNTILLTRAFFFVYNLFGSHFSAIFRRSGGALSLVVSMDIINLFVIFHSQSKTSKLLFLFHSLIKQYTRITSWWAASEVGSSASSFTVS